MYQYLYVSSATELWSETQLEELLQASRARNHACGVTGLLVYVRGSFIQLLEGARADVEATQSRIAADPRHRGLISLHEGECSERDFPDWSMAFPRLEPSQADALPGYSNFLSQAGNPETLQSTARKLLAFFRQLNV